MTLTWSLAVEPAKIICLPWADYVAAENSASKLAYDRENKLKLHLSNITDEEDHEILRTAAEETIEP